MTTRQVQVQICSYDDAGSYSFLCPECRIIVNKPAEKPIIDLLISAGVQVHTWELPAELSEPKTGPPITYDDLLAFHFDLESEHWLEQMISGGR